MIIGDRVRNCLSESIGVITDIDTEFAEVDYGNGPKKTSVQRLSLVNARVPRSLRIQGMKPEYAQFLEYLKTPAAKCLLTLEAQNPEMDLAIRQQYQKLTGDELVEGSGYNVAPNTANKQGCEGSVTFVVPDELPLAIRDMMVQRSGLVNRIEFLWMLVEQGFRITR